MESIIKWNTGNPREEGEYLVQLSNGRLVIDKWRSSIGCWGMRLYEWSLYNKSKIVAWCKLSKIKLYKEEME